MDLIDGSGFWLMGNSGTVPPTPPQPSPAVVPFAGAGPIRTIYRQGETPNDLALLLALVADE